MLNTNISPVIQTSLKPNQSEVFKNNPTFVFIPTFPNEPVFVTRAKSSQMSALF